MQHSTLSINEQEYYFLSELLDKGYPLLKSLSFIGKDEIPVKQALEKGMTIEDILIKDQKGRFYTHMEFFLKVSSLSGAIKSALHMMKFEGDIKKKLLKQCSYPMFLLVFAFVILLFFTNYIIPQMLNSFEVSDDFSFLMILLKVLRSAFLFCVIVLAGAGILYLVSSFQPKKRSEWIYHNRKWIPLCKDILSYQLSGYLYELSQKGVSTRMSFQYLMHVKDSSLLHVFMKHMISALENGKDLQELIQTSQLLNASFKQMYQIGSCNDSLCEMLTMFMKQQETVWEKLIKRVGLSIQCVAYTFIGCMVFVVYQIMLVPLGMLNTM